ncbi:hypothetical protein CNMCM5878_009930 [Aspergillus fumigatiaffinis]|nr:hypothetical protein CNMCM5878_009930 [Aspergillus fumigatiaffinis]
MTDAFLRIPQEPFFTELFQRWQESPNAIIIRDLATNTEATVGQFLYDVLTQRDFISNQLDEESHKRLRDPDCDVFVAIFGGAGYEFAVLFFAIYSLVSRIHLEEAQYFFRVCKVALITATQAAADEARNLSAPVGMKTFVLTPGSQPTPAHPEFVLEQASTPCNPDKGFVVLWTSGTTGPPKGVLLSRRSAYLAVQAYQKALGLSPEDTWLHQVPTNWKGGFDFFIACIYSGTCLEFCADMFSPQWFWQRMQQGGITCAVAPTPLLDMLSESLDVIRNTRPLSEYEQAIRGLRDLRVLCTGSMRVPESAKSFWRELRGGRPLVNLYGMTEVVGMISMMDWKSDTDGPAVNDEGELCVKGPLVMKKYLSSDPHAMEGVFDSEGFYKTGDLGSIGPNREIFVLGRASQDVIRFLGWKLNAPEIEEALCRHPQVSRAYVIGVADHKTDQRVAALIIKTESTGDDSSSMQLANLRRWLAIDQGLPFFKLPTMLRVIPRNHPVPTTATGKPAKREIHDVFFGPEEIANGAVELWDLATEEPDFGNRPWDWEGVEGK